MAANGRRRVAPRPQLSREPTTQASEASPGDAGHEVLCGAAGWAVCVEKSGAASRAWLGVKGGALNEKR